MEFNIKLFLLMLMFSKSLCEECITYNFEEGFNTLFTSTSNFCFGMDPWNLRNFTSIGIDGIHPSSSKFISPSSQASCTSSFNFPMGRGTFDFKVYVADDQMFSSILIYVIATPRNVVTFLGYDTHSLNFVQGWNTLRITIDRPLTFEGYVVLMGTVANPEAVVLVDSFRYIPSSIEEENCIIYEKHFLESSTTTNMFTEIEVTSPTSTDHWITTKVDDQETVSTQTGQWITESIDIDASPSTVKPWTTESTDLDKEQQTFSTVTDEWTTMSTDINKDIITMMTTTEKFKPSSTCITYDFEENFEKFFLLGSGPCDKMNPWTLSNFTSLGVQSFHPSSTVFISPILPARSAGCVASFNFLMEAGGILELNFYIDNVQQTLNDFILIWIMSSDATIQTLIYDLHSPNFVPGWRKIRMTIQHLQIFEGRFVLLGSAAEGSVMLVDSFRYIPPMIDEDECIIYKDHFTTPSVTTANSATDLNTDGFDVDKEGSTFIISETWTTEPIQQTKSTKESWTTESLKTDAHGVVSTTVEQWTTDSTDFNDQQTNAVTDPWVTESTDPDNHSTVSTVTNSTDSNGQQTSDAVTDHDEEVTVSAITKPWTTESVDFSEGETSGTTTSTNISDQCIIYNFEENFNTTFFSGAGLCTGAYPWYLKNYSTLEIKSLHALSTSFISPTNVFSCVSSSNFKMGSGIFEFNVFMGNEQHSNFTLFWMINILIQIKTDHGIDETVAVISYNSHSSNFIVGWNKLTLIIDYQWEFDGHIVLMGMASKGSILLVDSFRYIPSTMNQDICKIYEDNFSTPSLTSNGHTTNTYTDDSELIKTTAYDHWTKTTAIDQDIPVTGIWTSESTNTGGQQTDFVVTEQSTTHTTGSTEQEQQTTLTDHWITKTTIVDSDEITNTGLWNTESTTSSHQQTDSVLEQLTTAATDADDQEPNSAATNQWTKTTVIDQDITVTGIWTSESNDVGSETTVSVVTEQWTAHSTGSTDFEVIDLTTTESWTAKTSDNDVQETTEKQPWTTKATELNETYTTTEDAWTTELTDLDQMTSLTITDQWVTNSPDFNSSETTLTQSWTTESSVSNTHETSATVTEQSTMKSTDLDEIKPNSTETDQWITKTTIAYQESTTTDYVVTEQWTAHNTGSTVMDEKDTESTTTEPWTARSTDNDVQETTEPEVGTTDFTVSEQWETVATIKETWSTTSAPNADGCIVYDFEKNFDVLFLSREAYCRGMMPWTLNNFTSTEIENHNPLSNVFISPTTALSCVKSFNFVMGNGSLEVNVYIGDTQVSNIINVLVIEATESGNDSIVETKMYSPMSPYFVEGWNVLRIKLDSPRDFEGYFVLQGALARRDSIVLVDSFMYIPATVNANLCSIY